MSELSEAGLCLTWSGTPKTSFLTVWLNCHIDSTSRQKCHHIFMLHDISRVLGEKMVCFMSENKDADQLCSNCTADQHLCFRYTDRAILFLLISEISRFWSSATCRPVSVTPGRKP